MRKKRIEHNFHDETVAEIEAIKMRIGQQVSLSTHYTRGPKPTLIAVEGELATLVFPNGAKLERVPVRDLVDNSAFWKQYE